MQPTKRLYLARPTKTAQVARHSRDTDHGERPGPWPILFEDTLSDLLGVGKLADQPASVALHESLYEALIKFIRTGYGQIPVVDDDEQGRLVGVLSL